MRTNWSFPCPFSVTTDRTFLVRGFDQIIRGLYVSPLAFLMSSATLDGCAAEFRLTDFNARWLVKYPSHHKSGTKTISVIDDFMQELKESEVITVFGIPDKELNSDRRTLGEQRKLDIAGAVANLINLNAIQRSAAWPESGYMPADRASALPRRERPLPGMPLVARGAFSTELTATFGCLPFNWCDLSHTIPPHLEYYRINISWNAIR
jgi:hypothetical protein